MKLWFCGRHDAKDNEKRFVGRADEKLTAFLELEAGWSWGCVSAIDSNGRTIWIADAHRDDGKAFRCAR